VSLGGEGSGRDCSSPLAAITLLKSLDITYQWQRFSTAKFIFPILKSLDIQNMESQSLLISLQYLYNLTFIFFFWNRPTISAHNNFNPQE
jgi:hypothetical protein